MKHRNIRKSFFNLIEVTMAIAVVGIGIAGIMALLPPAVEANKSADYNNYTGDVVSTLATYIETELRNDWSTAIGKLPSSKPGISDLQFTPDHDDISKPENQRRWKSVNDALSGLYYLHNESGNLISGAYGVKTIDEGIRANILVWTATASGLMYHKPNGSAIDSESIGDSATDKIRVFFELSYPAARPYNSREKKLYVYEFYKR